MLPCSLINKIVFRRLRTIISSTFFSPLFFFHIDAQYQVSFKSDNEKNYLKNQFPNQSSTLREYLINVNNLSGIVRWSYLFFFFLKWFFSSTAVTTGTQRVHGSSRLYIKVSLVSPSISLNSKEFLLCHAKIETVPLERR